MNEYPISTLASIFPPMLDEDFNKLVDSIKENGLLEPVTVWRGEIIDGKHRYKACKEASVECRFVELEDDIDPIVYITGRNDIRRHLTPSQRSVVAYKLIQLSQSKNGNSTICALFFFGTD